MAKATYKAMIENIIRNKAVTVARDVINAPLEDDVISWVEDSELTTELDGHDYIDFDIIGCLICKRPYADTPVRIHGYMDKQGNVSVTTIWTYTVDWWASQTIYSYCDGVDLSNLNRR